MGELKKITRVIFKIFYSFIIILFLFKISLSQSIESAKDKLSKGDYTGAEKELKQLLEVDRENIEASKLLNEVEQIKKKKNSLNLTEKALIEINNRRFKKAEELLQEAISLDPSNSRARELYTSIYEIKEIEKEAVEEERRDDLYKLRRGFITVSTLYTFADSNRLDYIDSKVSMIGYKLDGGYYFGFLERRLGLSADYSGYLFKTSGNVSIDFLIHRLNASIRFRTFLFENKTNTWIVGIRANYHYFYLKSLKEEGAYNFKRIYGPSFGLFTSDPIINRFYKSELFKDIGFEGEIHYLSMIEKDDPPSVIEFYVGTYYRLNRFNFNRLKLALGYRLYRISESSINETYNDIEFKVGYNF